MKLWQNYITMACCLAPPFLHSRFASPERGNASPESSGSEKSEKISRNDFSAKDLFKLLVPLLKSEGTDMKESVVVSLGHCSADALA